MDAVDLQLVTEEGPRTLPWRKLGFFVLGSFMSTYCRIPASFLQNGPSPRMESSHGEDGAIVTSRVHRYRRFRDGFVIFLFSGLMPLKIL